MSGFLFFAQLYQNTGIFCYKIRLLGTIFFQEVRKPTRQARGFLLLVDKQKRYSNHWLIGHLLHDVLVS